MEKQILLPCDINDLLFVIVQNEDSYRIEPARVLSVSYEGQDENNANIFKIDVGLVNDTEQVPTVELGKNAFYEYLQAEFKFIALLTEARERKFGKAD